MIFLAPPTVTLGPKCPKCSRLPTPRVNSKCWHTTVAPPFLAPKLKFLRRYRNRLLCTQTNSALSDNQPASKTSEVNQLWFSAFPLVVERGIFRRGHVLLSNPTLHEGIRCDLTMPPLNDVLRMLYWRHQSRQQDRQMPTGRSGLNPRPPPPAGGSP